MPTDLIDILLAPKARSRGDWATGMSIVRSNSRWPPRSAQRFDEGKHLLVEAGTGVGKSFAYLLPAIDYAVRKKKRVVISTHTISLQEQLIEKDIPLIAVGLSR